MAQEGLNRRSEKWGRYSDDLNISGFYDSNRHIYNEPL